MREIVIISGKGGTGKTSLCAAFSNLARNAVLCDLDVDAPDMHILLAPQVRFKEAFISGNMAAVDTSLCVGCGACLDLCRFDAARISNGKAVIDSLFCEGCGVCVDLCPAKAIHFHETCCGEWYISDTRMGVMVHAQLFPGQENSGRLVTLLKRKAREIAKEKNLDMILCDGSPGVGCPVISSLSGADLAVAVVEPTPSGRYDFQRVASLCEHFRIPVAVVINKANLNGKETALLEKECADRGHVLLGHIPFEPAVTQAMVQRKALTELPGRLGETVRRIWDGVLSLPATRLKPGVLK